MIVKKYVLALLLAFSVILSLKAMDDLGVEESQRPWPTMQYEGKDETYQLVSLRDVEEEPFVKFVTELLSTKGVFALYGNGEPCKENEAKDLWDRVYPRTVAWFRGENEVLPWAVVQQASEPKKLVGFLGAHLHTINKEAKEYKGVEICCATHPSVWNQGAISGGLRMYAQAFSPQLSGLKEQFNRVFAPISPVNLPSLNLAFSLGFEVGASDSPDKPYVSGYFPDLKLEEAEKERLLAIAEGIAKNVKEGRKESRSGVLEQLEPNDRETLKALRIVVVMPRESFLKKFLLRK